MIHVLRFCLVLSSTYLPLPLAAVLGQIIFIAGLAALDDDINGTCVQVKPVGATEPVCLSASFGIYYFIWFLQCVVFAGLLAGGSFVT